MNMSYTKFVILALLCMEANASEIDAGNDNTLRYVPHVLNEKPSVRFLVAVNFTEQPNCMATALTQPLEPKTKYNSSDVIHVGACDQGPFQFWIDYETNGVQKVTVTFHSSLILDASPPSCDITWSGDYLLPPPPSENTPPGVMPSLLPGCFVMDSREGYHMTYYWFYILDWQF